ncbi:hypothetical protein RHECNPAF_1360019 [Rhizobium etli CNPAF512]|nr:hypothetical protein RHECNPAF_1360019 [Rhizobium etli CNPAF512]
MRTSKTSQRVSLNKPRTSARASADHDSGTAPANIQRSFLQQVICFVSSQQLHMFFPVEKIRYFARKYSRNIKKRTRTMPSRRRLHSLKYITLFLSYRSDVPRDRQPRHDGGPGIRISYEIDMSRCRRLTPLMRWLRSGDNVRRAGCLIGCSGQRGPTFERDATNDPGSPDTCIKTSHATESGNEEHSEFRDRGASRPWLQLPNLADGRP